MWIYITNLFAEKKKEEKKSYPHDARVETENGLKNCSYFPSSIKARPASAQFPFDPALGNLRIMFRPSQFRLPRARPAAIGSLRIDLRGGDSAWESEKSHESREYCEQVGTERIWFE